MEYTGLCGKIEEKIAECREKYERDREDPYRSHVWNSELETLENLYERIRKEGLSPALSANLEVRLAELEEDKEREEAAPSFSWYGDHYNYLVLEGVCSAYRDVTELLKENEK